MAAAEVSISNENRVQRILGPSVADGGVPVDAVVFEQPESTATLTQFPIEQGADINDHRIIQPKTYTMRAYVTDFPSRWKDTEYQHIAASTRHTAAYALLEELFATSAPFDIQTHWSLIPNVVIVYLSPRWENGTHDNALLFEARLKQVNIVGTLTSPIDEADLAHGQAADSLGTEQNQGKVEAEETLEPTLLRQGIDLGIDFISGLFNGGE